MKNTQNMNKKGIVDFRKQSIANRNGHNNKDEGYNCRNMKSMGRKYAQDSIFKQRVKEIEKQHHEVVMSDEFIKSSKLYRMLREKMQISDAVHLKEYNHLNQNKSSLKERITSIHGDTYKYKVQLWQLKNQIMELKSLLHDEEQENNKLLNQINQIGYQEEDEEQISQQQFKTNEQNVSQSKQINISEQNKSIQKNELSQQNSKSQVNEIQTFKKIENSTSNILS